MLKKGLTFILGLILLAHTPLTGVVFADAYNYDFWGQPRPTKAGYKTEKVILGEKIDLTLPQDLTPVHVDHITDFFVTEDYYFLVDRRSARVAKLNHELETIHVSVGPDDAEFFLEPRGIFVTQDNEIYVTDYQREAIYVFDINFNHIRTIRRPDNPTYGNRPFAVDKIVLDRTKRIYVTVGNVYDGIVELTNQGEFSRFYGVQEVSVSPIDLLWRRFMTQAQLDQTVLFLPVEYTNVTIDPAGFIYATATSESRTPIQRLNPNGNDVLRRNGYVPPTGDAIRRRGDLLPNNFVSVAVNDFGMYSVVDRASRRIFTYNDQGYLIFVTGEEGDGLGQFRTPTTVVYHGDQLIVADSTLNSLTFFSLTAFGELVTEAHRRTFFGDYEGLSLIWAEILDVNPNFFYAYVGLADEHFRQRRFEEAMQAYRQGFDHRGYSKAYAQLRRENLRDNFSIIGLSFILLVTVTIVRPIIKDIRQGGDQE
jgi:DNA-binding beta-propeller fold protein YncE